MATVTERSYDAQRKADARAEKRDLIIPAPLNVERREACEASTPLWLSTYCPDVFYNPFTFHQRRIIDDCDEVLLYGTQKCKAAQRGGGKSSVLKYAALKYALRRQIRFPLLISATSTKSKKTLQSLERRLATSAIYDPRTKGFRLLNALAEDYPLECCIAAYVDPWPSRARNVTANGGRSVNCEWGADWFIIPTWADEEPLGPIMLALGITSDELQGCNIYDQRPDFVLLDDLDSRDSLAAQDGVMAGKIEEIIDKTVAGLAGQSRRLGQFMLCTITSRQAAAYKYSDPAQKPAWSGERIPAILKWPERRDLWDQYIALRQAGKSDLKDGKPKDVFGRESHALYLANREEMDRGAEVENPYNYESGLLPDGTQKQVSALQACFDYIADYGMESFLTEKQNDPPEEDGAEDSGITPQLVMSRTNGLDRCELPRGCQKLTVFIDLGDRICHWCAIAWTDGCIGYVVDYGIELVDRIYVDGVAQKDRDPRALEVALLETLRRWRSALQSTTYKDGDGVRREPDIILVDSGDGDHKNAVYTFVKESGGAFHAAKGIGKGKFHMGQPGPHRKHFEECYSHFQPDERIWLYNHNSDHWKRFAHQRFLTQTRDEGGKMQAGTLSLFDCPKVAALLDERKTFAYQVVGEVWVEQYIQGKGWKKEFVSRGKHNHFLDAVSGCCCGAAIEGIRLVATSKPKKERTSLAALKAQAGRKVG